MNWLVIFIYLPMIGVVFTQYHQKEFSAIHPCEGQNPPWPKCEKDFFPGEVLGCTVECISLFNQDYRYYEQKPECASCLNRGVGAGYCLNKVCVSI